MIGTSQFAIKPARGAKFGVSAGLIVGVTLFVATTAFAQQQQQPWSEQVPAPQGPGPYNGPQGAPGPNADPGGPGDDQGDAPDRGVARISLMNGNVSVRRGDSGDLVAAIVNAPLTAGDRVVTAGDGRAEIELDSAHLFRVSPSSEVRLSELEYHKYQIQIAAGTTIFRVVRPSDAQVEISTPSVSVHPLQPGVYRVSVLPDGTSEITVRLGDAEVFSPRGSEPLHVGKTMMARGSAADPEFQLVDAVAQDEFEHWCIQRDQQLARYENPQQSPSARNVNPDITGAEDLDSNGRWVNDPSYGNVWVPTAVDPGWAPYSCGRWVWLDFYGWTWEGCESWGWAPYHYGRWFHGGYGWAWWPGPSVGRYYWHPALVGFFGWGTPGFGVGVGFGFGFGNIGWVPLAPFEAFHPWYGRGFYGAGFGGARVVNNINVINTYHNARFTNAVSSVRAGEFGRGAVGSANLVRAPASELARAGMVRGQLPVAPTRESTQFSSRAVNAQSFPNARNTSFASHMPASSASRIPFEQQRSNMTSRGVSPVRVNPSLVQNRGGSTGAASGASGASNNGGGWRSFDPSSRGGNGAGISSERGSPAGERNRGATGAPNNGGFNSPRGSAGEPNRGAAGSQNNGGWRSYDGNRGSSGGAQAQPQSGARGGYPSSGSYSQPRNYPQSGGYSAPRSYSPPARSGGSARPSGGGSRGGGGHSGGGGHGGGHH